MRKYKSLILLHLCENPNTGCSDWLIILEKFLNCFGHDFIICGEKNSKIININVPKWRFFLMHLDD